MDDNKRGGHTKYSLKVHLIFVTKYRKKILVGERSDDVKQYIYNAANTCGCHIIQMETDKDHVHILLSYKPHMRLSDVVRQLKQQSTFWMWQKHGRFFSKHYWKKKIMWSDGYFASSIGKASQATIEYYIKNQG